MGALTTASRRVLNLVQEDDGMMLFSNIEEGMEQEAETQMWLPSPDWSDMGEPQQITVTIELGDKLNADDMVGYTSSVSES